jgi:uncharacterized protein YbbK (DUF523 family)/predicted RNA-binding protein with PUA-like domain
MKRGEPPVRVGVSACLLGQEVRWDGGHKRNGWIAADLAKRVVLVPVCPEVEIGLGVPRPPIRLRSDGEGGVRLLEPSSGRDLSRRMERFAARRLQALEAAGLSGYVLKARSPSCGKEGVDLFGPGGGPPRKTGRGLFAAALLRRLPDLPVEEEERLRDPRARREFLERVLAYHRRGRKGATAMDRWLLKTDPDTYSFADLERDGTTRWDGVSNALALRHLRAMAAGDAVLVYETGDVKAIVGTATVAKGAYADPKAKDPRLVVVDLRAGKRLARPVLLAAVKADRSLADFPLVRMGRLSVMPVTAAQWERIAAPR